MSLVSVHTENIRIENSRLNGIEAWIDSVVASEGYVCGEIAIVLMDDEALLEINNKYLLHDYYTDVITFDYSVGQVVSGDVFLSIDRVSENAKELKNSVIDELHRVIVHGVLHLCGYKDKTPEDKEIMTGKEDYYLSLRAF